MAVNKDSDVEVTYETSTSTVIILAVLLVCVIALLVFLYKKLNRESNGEYTVQRIVYKEGGLRDRARSAAVVLGTRLGVQLWPGGASGQDGEEMQGYGDEEGNVEGCDPGSDKQDDDDDDDGDEATRSDTSGDNSSVEGSCGGHSESGAAGGAEAAGQEEDGEEAEKEEAGEGTGLLVTLNQFSGSAIWSGEGGDVTAL